MSMYLVCALKEELSVNVLGLKQKIGLVWADGMVGAMTVFKDKASAEAYVGDSSAKILEIDEVRGE
jgi:hypothetical protein